MLQYTHFLQASNMDWTLLETEADFFSKLVLKVSRRFQEWHLLFPSGSRTPASLERKKKNAETLRVKSKVMK